MDGLRPDTSPRGSANLIPVAAARGNRQIMPIIVGYVGLPEDFLVTDVTAHVAREG
jgi:hypothetical protein